MRLISYSFGCVFKYGCVLHLEAAAISAYATDSHHLTRYFALYSSHTLHVLSKLQTGKVSLDRLNDFLQQSELLDAYLAESNTTVSIPAPYAETSKEIGFRNASFSWSLDEEESSGFATPSSRIFRLRVEGELLFKRNGINMIIGPT